ncbi:hypothetical protein K4K61_000293 [Colletotrichum sp. SAR11_59]|uniref:Integral membrane protein n=1 Tax=Colletotrichum asianum TaxID=702518 RepID=A0A8H3W5N2_9PEZI|nr:integral membrane protein [Colletotrichum asianum]KAI8310689.1 hypothetical protein K4K61_000293 [Colletotrichum sp. SAR11_59]
MARQANVAASLGAAASAGGAGAIDPRDRIMSHMNRDHKRELSYYLQHFAGLGRGAASSPWMKDVSFEGMTIAAGGLGGKEYFVAFNPALTSWEEVRPAVVDMARVSREALGYSDITVSHFEASSGFALIVGISVAFYFVCYLTLGFVLPGRPIWGFLQTVFPGGPLFYRWLVKTIFFPVLGIHLTECWWFHRTRLVKHGIEPGSSVWWQWVSSLFFEGYPGFQRFDALVAAKRKEQAEAGKSH